MGPLDQAFEKAQRLKIPLAVHFDLTYRCHQRCRHCYLPADWRQGQGPGPELDTVQVCRILDQLAAAGAFFLTFSGGEVFLRDDLMAILEYARSLNYTISLMTSGTWGFGEKQIRDLLALGVEGVYFSLYSLEPEVHDRITGLPGSWKRLWEALELCQTHNLSVVLNCLIFKLNQAGLGDLEEFVRQKGIPFRFSNYLSPRWDARPHGPELIGDPEEHSRLAVEKGGKGEKSTPDAKARKNRCGAGLSLCYISPLGEVWPCLEVPWSCGRLAGDQDFDGLWQGAPALEKVRALQQRLDAEEAWACDLTTEGDQDDGKELPRNC